MVADRMVRPSTATAGEFAGVVAQGAKGRGLGCAARRARRGVGRGEGRSRACRRALPAEDAAAAALFGGSGYREVRRFYEMAIELEARAGRAGASRAARPRDVPRGGRRRIPRGDDASRSRTTGSGTAHRSTSGGELRARTTTTTSLWFLVRDGDEIAAVVRNEAREAGGYVGAARRPRARGAAAGSAKALLQRTFAEFWRRGLTRVTLGVDAESPTGATKLYERSG